MDWKITLLSICFLLPISTCVNPGLKIRITQSGLNYAATQAINSLDVVGQKIPDVHGTDDVKVGKVDYDITGVSVQSFTSPESHLTIQSGQGVHWSVQGCSAVLAGNWHYHYKMGFISIKDHGTFTLSIQNAGIQLGFTLGVDSQGRPTIRSTSCSSSIQRVDVSLHGGAAWLYRIFDDQISDAFKKQMVVVLCKQAENAINIDAEQALQRLKVVLPIQNTGILDYKMLVAPIFATGYVDSYHKGEIYYVDHEEAPYTPAPFPESFDTGKMAYIWISDYLLNTAGWALQKQHILQYFFTPNDLKPDQRYVMNTTCPVKHKAVSCIGNLIPKLQDEFPGCTVSINMSTSEPPTLEVTPNDILGHFEGNIVFYINFPNKTTKYAFTAHVVANVSLTLAVSNQKITAKVTTITPNFTVTDTKIGSISGAALTWIFSNVLNPQFIIPQFNTIGAQGLDLPGTEQITYVNPNLKLVQNAVVLSTDLKWTPDFKLQKEGGTFQNHVLYFQQENGKASQTAFKIINELFNKNL